MVKIGEGRRSGAFGGLGSRLARPFFGESVNLRGEPRGLVCVRIEVVTDPFGEFGVPFVLRVLDSFEELGIAPGAAAVLGRAAVAGADSAHLARGRRGARG